MLSFNTTSKNIAGRCLLFGISWLLLMLICPLLPGVVSEWCGLLLAMIIMPLAIIFIFRQLMSLQKLILLIVVTLLSAATYKYTYFIPSKSFISVITWLALGLVGVVASLSIAMSKSQQSHNFVMLCFTALWLSTWNIAMIAANPHRISHDVKLRCAVNIGKIGIARNNYECRYGKPPSDIHQLIKSGILDARYARCPLKKDYIELADLSGGDRNKPYLIMCPNHFPHLILLDRNGAVLTFTTRKRFEKIGYPWWLRLK